MTKTLLIITALATISCAGTDPLEEAKTAIEAQREICDGVAKYTPSRIAAVRAVDEELADGLERTQEMCEKINAGKARVKDAADAVSDTVSE